MFRKGRPALQSAPAAVPGNYSSPGLVRVAEHLARDGKHQILDLGSALQDNLDFLSQFPARIFFEQLEGTLAGLRAVKATAEADNDTAPPPFAGLFSYPAGVRFDLILAWDLFDYLEPEQIGAIRERLSPYLARRCLLFCLISNQAEIPSDPQRYRILPQHRLAYEPRGLGRIPGPRHCATGLKALLRDFTLERSVLLQNGVQEYLFKYLGQK